MQVDGFLYLISLELWNVSAGNQNDQMKDYKTDQAYHK